MWVDEFEPVAVGCEGGFGDDGVRVGVDAPVADEFVYVECEGAVETAEFFDVPVVALVVGGDGDGHAGAFTEETVISVDRVLVVGAESTVSLVRAVAGVNSDVLHFGSVFDLHHLVSHTLLYVGRCDKVTVLEDYCYISGA